MPRDPLYLLVYGILFIVLIIILIKLADSI